MILRACWFLLLTLVTLPSAVGDEALAGTTGKFRLTLPPVIYAVLGVEVSLYFENTVLVAEASAYPNEVARLLALPGNPHWTMKTITLAGAGDGFSIASSSVS